MAFGGSQLFYSMLLRNRQLPKWRASLKIAQIVGEKVYMQGAWRLEGQTLKKD